MIIRVHFNACVYVVSVNHQNRRNKSFTEKHHNYITYIKNIKANHITYTQRKLHNDKILIHVTVMDLLKMLYKIIL